MRSNYMKSINDPKLCFYFLFGALTSTNTPECLDYDLCSFYLIHFGKQIKSMTSAELASIHPCLFDDQLIHNLVLASTNHPLNFSLIWFYDYFKKII